MRHALLGCLAAALIAAEPSPITAPVVTFVPIRCDLRSDLRFDAAGKPEREHGMLAITLRAIVPPGLTVAGWGAATLTRIQTESGETLTALPSRRGHTGLAREERAELARVQVLAAGGGDPALLEALPLTLRLAPPLRPSFSLARLDGSVELRWRRGEIRLVRVSPIVVMADAPTVIDGVPNGTMTIRSHSERDISVTWSDALAARLQRVRFEDADGNELPQRGRGMATRNGIAVSIYQVAVPETGAMVLEVLPETVTSLIPITLEGIQLPGTGAAPMGDEPMSPWGHDHD